MLQTLYTLALPEFSAADAEFIARFRRQHDALVDMVLPHFTLVFACSAVPLEDYLAHVAQVTQVAQPAQPAQLTQLTHMASGQQAINFCIRHAQLGTDDVDDTAYVFLVPDEGHAALALLHDALYRGPLAPQLRLDLPYTPHVTIGRLRDRPRAKALVDELNTGGICLHGRVQALQVMAREGDVLKPLAVLELKP